MSTRYKGSLISATPASSSSTAAYGLWKQSDAAQLVNTAWPNIDPYWSSVSTLVTGEAATGADNLTFIDSSTNNFTITSNNVYQGTANPFSTVGPYSPTVNGGSGYFNTVTSTFLTPSSSTAWSFGTGAFTIEFWMNPLALNATNGVIVSNFIAASGAYVVGQWKFGCNNSASGQLAFTWATSTTVVSTITSGANLPTLNTWQHVAIVRNNTTITIYLNGVSVGSGTMSTSLGATGTLAVGYQQTGSTFYYNGYLSNVRIVKGTAVYTTAFTPPTAPLTAISGTQLLLGFTNATIIDNSMTTNFTYVSSNSVAISSSTFKYGSGSLYNNGSSLSGSNSTKLQLGTGDFTIEGWVSFSTSLQAYAFVSRGAAATGWEINCSSTNVIQFLYTTSTLTGTTVMKKLTWYHFAVVRSGSAIGNVKIYLNGVLDATSAGAVTDNFNQAVDLIIGTGRQTSAASGLVGYIDDLRITKGVARYTANFTPPQQSLPIQ
jgi:hypothetical protein